MGSFKTCVDRLTDLLTTLGGGNQVEQLCSFKGGL